MNRELVVMDLKNIAAQAIRVDNDGPLCFELRPPIKVKHLETDQIFHIVLIGLGGHLTNLVKTKEANDWVPVKEFRLWNHVPHNHK